MSGVHMKYRLYSFLIGATCLAACHHAPTVPYNHYMMSTHDAYTKLMAADISDFKMNRQCGILIHMNVDPTPESQVTWHVTSEGQEMLSFSANLTPISSTETQIDISVSKDYNGKEDYDGSPGKYDNSLKFRRPAVNQPVRPAIRELINSTLAGRKFDDSKILFAQAEPGIEDPDEQSDGICEMQRENLQQGIGEGHFSIHDPESLNTNPS
jgi:hypothetical protein